MLVCFPIVQDYYEREMPEKCCLYELLLLACMTRLIMSIYSCHMMCRIVIIRLRLYVNPQCCSHILGQSFQCSINSGWVHLALCTTFLWFTEDQAEEVAAAVDRPV